MDAPETLNAAGAAAVLHADPETVLNLARSGALPGTKIGKSWVFLRADVVEFVRERVRQDTEQRRLERRQRETPMAVCLTPPASRRRRPPPILPALP